jgi:predicted acylesterase/phospholipase RssA
MTIKHLVFSGSGPLFLAQLGSIKTFIKKKYINMDNIESMYGTSGGAIVAVLLCLKYNLKEICDYCVNDCLYEDLFSISTQNILNLFKKKGLFDKKSVYLLFKPILKKANIPININFKELYELSKITLNIFTFEKTTKKMIKFNHITHPNFSVMKALYMSCSVPYIFSPIIEDNKVYIDAFFINNYPIVDAIKSGCEEKETFGFNVRIYNEDSIGYNLVNNIQEIIQKTSGNTGSNKVYNIKDIKYYFDYFSNNVFSLVVDFIQKEEIREELFKHGVKQAKMIMNE